MNRLDRLIRSEPLRLFVLLGALLTATALLGSLGSDSLDRAVVAMLVNAMLVVGLYTFVGISGVFSFGHLAFAALGGYATALLSIPIETREVLLPELPGFLQDAILPAPAAILVGGVVGAVGAAVFALPLSRLSGLTAGLATFATLVIVNVVLKNWKSLTGGTAGLSGIPLEMTVPIALAWALGVLALAAVYQRSLSGRRLRASREDEVAAAGVGVRIGRARAASFIVSGFMVGIGGGVFALALGSLSPETFYLGLTFITVVMLIIGGISTLTGAVIGTIAISALSEFLRRLEQGVDIGGVGFSTWPGFREVGLAVLMLAILIWRPQGLSGGREASWPAWPRHRQTRRREQRESADTPSSDPKMGYDPSKHRQSS